MSKINITNNWNSDFKSGFNISKQVCELINTYNHLGATYRPENILSYSSSYTLYLLNNKVLGCVKVEKQSYTFTELKHVCVREKFRKIGLSKVLIKRSLSKVLTPLVYATVRDDNIPSLKLFNSFGFKIGAAYFIGHRKKILTLIKKNNQWLKEV